MELAEQCRLEAEELYRSGKYHCAEAVLAVVRKHFRPDLPEEVVQMASGFGGGSGSGCICGAVSGGTVGLGLVLKEKKDVMNLTRQLHTWFRESYGATCCKTIRAAISIVSPRVCMPMAFPTRSWSVRTSGAVAQRS